MVKRYYTLVNFTNQLADWRSARKLPKISNVVSQLVSIWRSKGKLKIITLVWQPGFFSS